MVGYEVELRGSGETNQWHSAESRTEIQKVVSDIEVKIRRRSAVERDMRLVPFRVELAEANKYVADLHRHHAPVTGHRFSLGVGNSILRGVAICGRPVGRGIPHREVLEVVRLCTDGTRNACSFLYSAAARCATMMGFRAVITYTSAKEDGASLRACGWWPELLAERSDYSFSSKTRERAPKKGKDTGQKIRWLYLTGVG